MRDREGWMQDDETEVDDAAVLCGCRIGGGDQPGASKKGVWHELQAVMGQGSGGRGSRGGWPKQRRPAPGCRTNPCRRNRLRRLPADRRRGGIRSDRFVGFARTQNQLRPSRQKHRSDGDRTGECGHRAAGSSEPNETSAVPTEPAVPVPSRPTVRTRDRTKPRRPMRRLQNLGGHTYVLRPATQHPAVWPQQRSKKAGRSAPARVPAPVLPDGIELAGYAVGDRVLTAAERPLMCRTAI